MSDTSSSPVQPDPDYHPDKEDLIAAAVMAHRRTRDVYSTLSGRSADRSGHALMRLFAREAGMDRPGSPDSVNAAADTAWASRMLTARQRTARDDLV